MTPQDLAAKLDELALQITPTPWEIKRGLYSLAIRSQKAFIEPGDKPHKKPVTNICVFATVGIAISSQKEANAEFICLVKNELAMIRECLRRSTMAGFPKKK